MRLAALALDVEEDFFDDKVDRSIGTMRLNYYPAQAAPPEPGQLRASAHTDYGGFTILSGEDVPGRPAGAHARRPLGRRADLAHHLRGEHRRPAHALDQRPLALEPAPRGEPARRRARPAPRACPSPSSTTRTTTRSSSACPRRAPPGTRPVLSGEYRDVKYAKTGFTAARTG